MALPEAAYTGREVCTACHAPETERWSGSHHDLAMQVADDSTVLGDFDDASFSHFGVTTTFIRRAGKFFARTDGPDGRMGEYQIRYTFGVDPLQQYLVRFPDGRIQVLGLCWDTRPAAEGGQRWFHIYPGEPIPHDDALHWTGPSQNWNHMCAECHSTDLRKRYVEAEDRFETTWSEIDVSCEACHGPGSRHVAWAREREQLVKRAEAEGAEIVLPETGDLGLAVRFAESPRPVWQIDPETGTAKRSAPRGAQLEVEMCGRCHSRRSPVHDVYQHGRPLLDTHRVAILDEALYYPDGQILEEVYVYGSFLQSRMYAAGVTCADCHDPHSGGLHHQGNALCARCHAADRFDVPRHHFHKADSPGASCVACHMPSRTYMVVDPRHDHSLRVPRPDLSLELGTPNACTAAGCHPDQSDRWAAEFAIRWYGESRRAEPHWGEAILAARTGASGAEEKLIGVLADSSIPAIARATAIFLLPRYAGPERVPVFEAALRDPSPLVRVEAAAATESLEPRVRLHLDRALLDDPIRAVRLEAGRVLASVPRSLLRGPDGDRLEEVLGEYRAAQGMDADRSDAHVRLGTLFLQRGELARAEAEFERALQLDRWFIPAYVNLADLLRIRGEDGRGERVLREALALWPDHADVRHALGLLLVREGRPEEALVELERAAALRPELPRYSFVLAVALHSLGKRDRALAVSQIASAKHPADRDLRVLLQQLESER